MKSKNPEFRLENKAQNLRCEAKGRRPINGSEAALPGKPPD